MKAMNENNQPQSQQTPSESHPTDNQTSRCELNLYQLDREELLLLRKHHNDKIKFHRDEIKRHNNIVLDISAYLTELKEPNPPKP